MKKYDDNDKRENAFLNLDVIEDKKSGKFVIIEKDGKSAFGTEKKEKERDFFVLTLIGCAILLVAVIFLLVGLLKYEEDPALAEQTKQESSETWRGAFFDRYIYDSCRKSTVKICLGRGSTQDIWTGFVYSKDGVIATSLDVKDSAKRGRLYVVMFDGSEYAVESISEDRNCGIALLKIKATELTEVVFREEKTVAGEKIIAIASVNDGFEVVSGEITSEDAGELGVNIMLDKFGVGAPIFDGEGKLLGIACGDVYDGRVRMAVSAENAKKCFFDMQK